MYSGEHELRREAFLRRRYRFVMAGMLFLLLAAVLLSFWVGYYPLSPLSGCEGLSFPFRL